MNLRPSDIVAALDVGDARIGVAMTRVMVALPQPVQVFQNDEQVWDGLAGFIKEHEVKALVIGLPRGIEGQETAQTHKVRDFAAHLQTLVAVPLYFQDEAVTSVIAEAELRARGGTYNKGMVDALAATYILEDFLRDNQKGKHEV